MKITINGEHQELHDGVTLSALVTVIGCGTKGVAIAVNEALVPRSAWAEHVLRSEDRVEVLKAAQGG